jgi:hypothetical protein
LPTLPDPGPPPGFTCVELGTQAVPDVGCTTNYHRRETGMVPVFDLKPSACQKAADHEAALHGIELEGLGTPPAQIKTQVAAFKAKNRATRAKTCAGGLRVWAKEFDCYVRAASPAEAAQCGDFSITSSRL